MCLGKMGARQWGEPKIHKWGTLVLDGKAVSHRGFGLRMEPVSQRQVSLNQSRTVGAQRPGRHRTNEGAKVTDVGCRVTRGGLEAG